MKIGIITFHFVNNYGGVLQAYALHKFIKKSFPVECRIIDYRHWFIRLTDSIRMLPVEEPMKNFVPWTHSIRARITRVRKFRSFIEKNGDLTDAHCTYRQLKSERDSFDLLICGSDQIWNPILTFGPAKAYFLKFAGIKTRKISYAASVGNPPCFKNKIAKYIRELDAVSIRERQEWLEKCVNLIPEQHIDPTFLLNTEDWYRVCAEPVSNEPYILVYFLQSNIAAYSAVEKIKKKFGYPVVDISRYGYAPGFIDKTLVNVGPEDFLGLFRHAAYVCTNSFHGLAFSIIFNKAFSFIPLKRFGYRIDALCDLFHIKRIARDGGAYYDIEYDSDYIEKVIQEERSKALNYIGNNIYI